VITKINRGNDLGATLRYVYREDATPEVVAGTAVGSSREQIERDMMKAIDRRADLKNPVVHMILSIPKEEHLTLDQWGEVAEEYTERMGFGKAPYIAVRHQDTEHEHIHIVASRVDVFGRPIRLSHDYYKSQEIARDLEQKYELGRVRSSWERETKDRSQGEYHLTQRTGAETRKERVRRELFGALEQCKDVPALASKLREKDIELVPKVTSDQSKVVGVVFKVEGWHIPGSRIDRALSWNRIAEKLEYEHARDFSRLSAPPEAPARATGEVSQASPNTPGRESAAELMRPVVPEPVSQESGQEKRERVQNELQAALEKAPYHKGWEAWAKALKEQEIEAIPKGTQSEEGKLRGMYFEKEGVRLPGSSVGREYSFGNLEQRLGVYEKERDAVAFARVHIPGVGDQAMPSRKEQAREEAPAVVQTPSPEASRSRAPEHGVRSVQPPQITPEERKEHMVADMRQALEDATVDQGWKAWTRSLREQGVEAIPKGTQADPGKLRGMYFEKEGVRVPGSEVGRAYSFGNLEKTLGAYERVRDQAAFERVYVPGAGDTEVSVSVEQGRENTRGEMHAPSPEANQTRTPEDEGRQALRQSLALGEREEHTSDVTQPEAEDTPRVEGEHVAEQQTVEEQSVEHAVGHDGEKSTVELFAEQLKREQEKAAVDEVVVEEKGAPLPASKPIAPDVEAPAPASTSRSPETSRASLEERNAPEVEDQRRPPEVRKARTASRKSESERVLDEAKRVVHAMDRTADEELIARLRGRNLLAGLSRKPEDPRNKQREQRERQDPPGSRRNPLSPGDVQRKILETEKPSAKLDQEPFMGAVKEVFYTRQGRVALLEGERKIALVALKEYDPRFVQGRVFSITPDQEGKGIVIDEIYRGRIENPFNAEEANLRFERYETERVPVKKEPFVGQVKETFCIENYGQVAIVENESHHAVVRIQGYEELLQPYRFVTVSPQEEGGVAVEYTLGSRDKPLTIEQLRELDGSLPTQSVRADKEAIKGQVLGTFYVERIGRMALVSDGKQHSIAKIPYHDREHFEHGAHVELYPNPEGSGVLLSPPKGRVENPYALEEVELALFKRETERVVVSLESAREAGGVYPHQAQLRGKVRDVFHIEGQGQFALLENESHHALVPVESNKDVFERGRDVTVMALDDGQLAAQITLGSKENPYSRAQLDVLEQNLDTEAVHTRKEDIKGKVIETLYVEKWGRMALVVNEEQHAIVKIPYREREKFERGADVEIYPNPEGRGVVLSAPKGHQENPYTREEVDAALMAKETERLELEQGHDHQHGEPPHMRGRVREVFHVEDQGAFALVENESHHALVPVQGNEVLARGKDVTVMAVGDGRFEAQITLGTRENPYSREQLSALEKSLPTTSTHTRKEDIKGKVIETLYVEKWGKMALVVNEDRHAVVKIPYRERERFERGADIEIYPAPNGRGVVFSAPKGHQENPYSLEEVDARLAKRQLTRVELASTKAQREPGVGEARKEGALIQGRVRELLNVEGRGQVALVQGDKEAALVPVSIDPEVLARGKDVSVVALDDGKLGAQITLGSKENPYSREQLEAFDKSLATRSTRWDREPIEGSVVKAFYVEKWGRMALIANEEQHTIIKIPYQEREKFGVGKQLALTPNPQGRPTITEVEQETAHMPSGVAERGSVAPQFTDHVPHETPSPARDPETTEQKPAPPAKQKSFGELLKDKIEKELGPISLEKEPVLSREEVRIRLEMYQLREEKKVHINPERFDGAVREVFRSEDGARWAAIDDGRAVAMVDVTRKEIVGELTRGMSARIEAERPDRLVVGQPRQVEVEKPRGLEREDARAEQAKESPKAEIAAARWISEQRALGEKVRLLEPTQRVRGVVEDKAIELKEGTFHVIRTRESERVLVQDAKLGEFKGEKATAYVNPSGRTFVESLERDRDR